MTETVEPPKVPFSQRFASERPKDEAELKAMNSTTAPPTQQPPPKPDPAPAKPAELAATKAPEDERDALIDSGKVSPKSEDWKRKDKALKDAARERDEFKAKTSQYEKELGELRKAPKHNAELIKKIESERDELKAKWQLVAAQFDSGFHVKYETKVNEAIAKIKDAVPADKMDKIGQLLQMPESDWKRRALAELTEDLDAPTITDIMIANREVRDILASRKKELDDSGTILKSSAEQRAKEQAERKDAYSKSFDAVLTKKSTGEDALPVLQLCNDDTPQAKEWNTGVAERVAVARAVFMDEFDSPEEKAEASIWAASAPGFLKELKAAQAENAQLKETLAKLQSSSPGIGAGGKAQEGGRKMTFTERAIANALP